MDIPDLVQQAVGDEAIEATVALDDEDAICLTPTRTIVYRGEGLLSDEGVEEFSHDAEQVDVSEGRRKTKILLRYIDGTKSFTVPGNRSEKVIELLLEGILRVDGVIESREGLRGVYRFSELTLVVTDGRLLKHIGEQVWNDDYESYDFEDVTGLEFEEASVATSVALSVDGRPQRIKVPNEQARFVRQDVEGALLDYYDVGSIEELNRVVADGADGGAEPADTTAAADEGDFEFGDDFDPLVSDEPAADAEGRPPGEAEPRDAGQPRKQGGDASGGAGQAQSGGGAERASGGQPQPNTAEASDPLAPDSSESDSPEPDRTRSDAPARAESADHTEQSADRAAQQVDSGRTDQPADRTEQPTETDRRTQGGADRSGGPRQAASGSTASRGGADAADNAGATASADASADGASSGQSARPAGSQQESDATRREADSGQSSDRQQSADGHRQHIDDRETAQSGDGSESASEPVGREEFEALAERVEELTEAVDRQNELLKRQHRALKRLVEDSD